MKNNSKLSTLNCGYTLALILTLVNTSETQNYTKSIEALNGINLGNSFNSNRTVNVSLDFNLNQIVSLESSRNKLVATGLLILNWVSDEANLTDGGRSLRVMAKDVWLPDVEVERGRMILGQWQGTRIMRVHDGHLEVMFRAKLEVECSMDMTDFPYDIQQCDISFTSRSFKLPHLDLHTARRCMAKNKTEENINWELMAVTARRYERRSRAVVSYHMVLRRSWWFHTIYIFSPLTVVHILALLGFTCMDRGCNYRTHKSVLLMASVVAYSYLFKLSATAISSTHRRTLLQKYYDTVFFSTILFGLLSIYVVKIQARGCTKAARRPSQSVRKVSLHWLAPLMAMVPKQRDSSTLQLLLRGNNKTYKKLNSWQQTCSREEYPMVERCLNVWFGLKKLRDELGAACVKRGIKNEWLMVSDVFEKLLQITSLMLVVFVTLNFILHAFVRYTRNIQLDPDFIVDPVCGMMPHEH